MPNKKLIKTIVVSILTIGVIIWTMVQGFRGGGFNPLDIPKNLIRIQPVLEMLNKIDDEKPLDTTLSNEKPEGNSLSEEKAQ